MNPQQIKVIKRCRESATFFMTNFVKIKHSSAGIVKFEPFDYQKNAIKSFRRNRFHIFKKTRQCFRGDQIVWTPKGPKRIDSIKAGDIVYSYDTKESKLVKSTVSMVHQNGIGKYLKVRTRSGHYSHPTSDHKFLTTEGYLSAESLPGKRVIEVQDIHGDGRNKPDEIFKLIGDLLTISYKGDDRSFKIPKQAYTNIPELIKSLTGSDFSFGPDPAKSLRIALSKLELSLDQTTDVELPEWVFDLNAAESSKLIEHIFRSNRNHPSASNFQLSIRHKSISLLNQMRQLLSRFGVWSAIMSHHGSNLHELAVVGDNSLTMFKRHIYDDIGDYDSPEDVVGVIEEVKQSSRTTKLWDLTIPPHHNYIVDGVVVHNCGISKVSGIFALWFAMFFANKTVLVVSRKDDDAMSFLDENIRFPFENLPPWLKQIYKPQTDNDHEIWFPNGSKIRSLTSNPDVLRSNSSSLNIIDEAAFIPSMDELWAAGAPTLTHGGSAIVISTTSGIGGWYWSTWTDAENNLNEFVPIVVNWYDMTWCIEYTDSLSGRKVKIAPTDGIVPTGHGLFAEHPKHGRIALDPGKYGKYWSPWLENQYRDLQSKGEDWKFQQEILADFVGSGNTILQKPVLSYIETTTRDDYSVASGIQTFIHPHTKQSITVDFTPTNANDGLRIWKEPIPASPDTIVNNQVTQKGRAARQYVMGVDIATGKGKDYHGIEIFDRENLEQVAEAMLHCETTELKAILDRLGRWYNNATMVVERNNGGDMIITDLRNEFNYPNIWRKSESTRNGVVYGQYGFFTSGASKAILNKLLTDFIKEGDGKGLVIRSDRLRKQLMIYIRRRTKSGKDTDRTEAESGAGNFDDLVMATALAIVGLDDFNFVDDQSGIPPITGNSFGGIALTNRADESFDDMRAMIPISLGGGHTDIDESATDELLKFSISLGSVPVDLIGQDAVEFVRQRANHMYNVRKRPTS